MEVSFQANSWEDVNRFILKYRTKIQRITLEPHPFYSEIKVTTKVLGSLAELQIALQQIPNGKGMLTSLKLVC